jgi:excinuclease ABC subunit A
MTTTEITVKGAREHNLRDVNLTLPRGELICFSGVSGSGKSSLAFDTLFAEGQRRYVESLSNYARQFMGQMPKPNVDLVSGLSPTISISQKSSGSNPRSTVGTITEIYDFLRVLYARVGTGRCPKCDVKIDAQSRDAITARIMDLPIDSTLWILAPIIRRQKGEFKDLFEDLRKQGYVRARVDGETIRLSEPPLLDRQKRHDVELVIDRVTPDERDRGRIVEAVGMALKVGETTLFISESEPNANQTGPVKRDHLFSSRYACGTCGQSYRAPTPQLFSFNSPQGMCEACDGLGRLYTFVPSQLVPDENLSVRKGAIELLGKWGDIGRQRRQVYRRAAESLDRLLDYEKGTMLEAKWKDLPEEAKKTWLWGYEEPLSFQWRGGRKSRRFTGSFEGFIPELIDKYRNTRNKMQLKHLEKYMETMDCPDCHGRRLNLQASAVTLRSNSKSFQKYQSAKTTTKTRSTKSDSELTLPELCDLPIDRLAAFFESLDLNPTETLIAGEALKEIRQRLGFLLGVGLDYLTLGRIAPTLSGGESQRIRLAGQIGSGLSGVLYILDEPSIGLHARDNDRLIETLTRLRDAGNTLIVVEHDEDTMRAADRIVDFGPGPGVKGGRVVAVGNLKEIENHPTSITGKFLTGERTTQSDRQPREAKSGPQLEIIGARHNNLKNVTASIPLGLVTCVTGVSGSGKSSLIGGIVEPALRNQLNHAECEVGEHEEIRGVEHLDKTIAIDQSPIGRTPRSNPATYVKVFDEIRNLFAKLPDSKTRGFTASRFSFNVDGGRCSACDGNGANKLEMDFLADIWVTCPVCQGKRYNRETLNVTFKGHSISEVLEMDIAQALSLFANIPKIAEKLQTLVDVGLEYLKLGQPSPTLSGGEAQRIKLARELSKKETGRTLYVLDEPTTGLHFADIELLLKVIQGLADRGNTLVIVEHNLDVIQAADWIIDLGPEGGDGGGEIIAKGPPRTVAKSPKSYTAKALAKALGLKHSSKLPERKRDIHLESEPQRARTHIVVESASEHNLKSVSVDVPRDAMTVFCGPSGSGKSSLSMDTIYAEGQRRYVESLSSYARQFIGQVQKPKVERIEGLSPAVALEQKNLGHSPRSTVGTVTEIYDYLRILLSRLGTMHCPQCHCKVGTQTSDQITEKILSLPESTKTLLLAPLEVQPGEASLITWQSLRAAGYSRVRIDGETYSLDQATALDPRRKQRVQVVVDRLVIRKAEQSRIADSVEQALSLGVGELQLAVANDERPEPEWDEINHSQHLVCEQCGRSFQELTPHHFSFNTAIGWCTDCDGLGTQTGTNPSALIGKSSTSLLDGAALLWPNVRSQYSRAMLRSLERQYGIPIHQPFNDLTVAHRRILFRGLGDRWIPVLSSDFHENGSDKKPDRSNKVTVHSRPIFRFQFKGFYPALDEASRLTPTLRGRLEPFVAEIDCASCDGSRLRDDSAAVRFNGFTIGDLVQFPLQRLQEVVKTWKLDRREKKIAGELVREIESRVKFLIDVGLGYLTLHRGAATLSGGEAQRIRLAAQLGSGLCGVLYVLDEPTIGLHPRDNDRLIGAMHRLRDLGNTLLVVEHDHDVIKSSDYVCDFGPRAGRLGGRIVAQGPPERLDPIEESVTGGYLNGSKVIEVPKSRRPVYSPTGSEMVNFLRVKGARENNLRNVDLDLPLGVFTAITGPSGSGKSSLIEKILYPSLARRLHRSRVQIGRHDSIEGLRYLNKVIQVDQSPLGNSPSSNPATYTGLFDHIRQAFAETPDACERRLTARHFSFNVAAGRCETCEGTGQLKIEMHFLPDVWVTCEECQGKRYSEEILEVHLHGKSIAEILEMSCSEALALFAHHSKISSILQTLCDVGLDYVKLGQSAPTLSGGEAQRVKLAAELSRPGTGNTLYLLDEPTTGLHFDDIQKLLSVLQRLVDLGNSVVLIEHNLDVIKSADWVIDMGPEAGAEGGEIVFAGTPEALAKTAADGKKKSSKRSTNRNSRQSHTAPYLATVLNSGSQPKEEIRSRQTRIIQETSRTSQVDKNEPKSQTGATSKTGGKKSSSAKTNDQRPRSDSILAAAKNSTKPQKTSASQPTHQLQPWKVLGRKWHFLSKGFQSGSKPKWQFQILEQLLEYLQSIASPDSLVFYSERGLTVHLTPENANSDDSILPWLWIETKNTEAIKLYMLGSVNLLDPELISKQKMPAKILNENPLHGFMETESIEVELSDEKHMKSRFFKSLLKTHFSLRSEEAS